MSDDKFAYNNFQYLEDISMNCINLLMEDNDDANMIWKLLYYNDRDAWNKTNLTKAQKRSLIYNGDYDETNFRVFLDVGQNDVWTNEVCVIRISPHSAIGKNRTVGIVTVSFEVFSHYKINTLSNYKTRTAMITQRLLKIFNGSRVGGLGQLYLDGLANPIDRMIGAGQIPFKGQQIFMSVNMA